MTFVNKSVINAFALPGGEIVVYSGIIHKMHSYEELVALVGHETGHIENRHTLRLMVKQVSTGLILTTFIQGYGGLSELMLQKVSEIHTLSYNREAEEVADGFGYKSMQSTGTDPTGMVALFKHMQKDSEGSKAAPEFLMTHPSLEHRILTVEKNRIKYKQIYTIKPSLEVIWKEIIQARNTKSISPNDY